VKLVVRVRVRFRVRVLGVNLGACVLDAREGRGRELGLAHRLFVLGVRVMRALPRGVRVLLLLEARRAEVHGVRGRPPVLVAEHARACADVAHERFRRAAVRHLEERVPPQPAPDGQLVHAEPLLHRLARNVGLDEQGAEPLMQLDHCVGTASHLERVQSVQCVHLGYSDIVFQQELLPPHGPAYVPFADAQKPVGPSIPLDRHGRDCGETGSSVWCFSGILELA
jgi:hypothetical protein